MTRIRSPNYPQIELTDAIALAAQIHKKEGTNFAPREVVAELLGHSSVNGASEKKVGALTAYGLLDRNQNKELRISDVAMRILFPDSELEKSEALAAAAMSPSLFKELRDKWPDTPPSDASLKAYLIRRGFNQNAVEQVVSIFRGALTLAQVESDAHSDDSTEEDRKSVV